MVLGQVKLENIKVYAHHGCLEEETIIGSHYRVDVSLSADLSKPMHSDRLTDTVDYVHINHIVKEEMKISSKLLEHVAHRIIGRIFSEIELVRKAKVSVSKINPPIGGDVEMVTIILSQKKDVS
jgi:dihydroneopterin aldolase